MVPPSSDRISRVPPYLSRAQFHIRSFRVRGYHPLWRDFPDASDNSNAKSRRLFPFRSPLLWESRLISVPLVTEMFQFSRFAPSLLCIQSEVTHTCFTLIFLASLCPHAKRGHKLRRANQVWVGFPHSEICG